MVSIIVHIKNIRNPPNTPYPSFIPTKKDIGRKKMYAVMLPAMSIKRVSFAAISAPLTIRKIELKICITHIRYIEFAAVFATKIFFGLKKLAIGFAKIAQIIDIDRTIGTLASQILFMTGAIKFCFRARRCFFSPKSFPTRMDDATKNPIGGSDVTKNI